MSDTVETKDKLARLSVIKNLYTKLNEKKLNENLGQANAGNLLVVGDDGSVTTQSSEDALQQLVEAVNKQRAAIIHIANEAGIDITGLL